MEARQIKGLIRRAFTLGAILLSPLIYGDEQTGAVLHDFKHDGPEGQGWGAGLVRDSRGNPYGITQEGSAHAGANGMRLKERTGFAATPS